jgi:hypothetical protein
VHGFPFHVAVNWPRILGSHDNDINAQDGAIYDKYRSKNEPMRRGRSLGAWAGANFNDCRLRSRLRRWLDPHQPAVGASDPQGRKLRRSLYDAHK